MSREGHSFPPMHTHLFASRHLGTTPSEAEQMARQLGYDSLAALIDAAVPTGIQAAGPLQLPAAVTEQEALAELRGIMDQNQVRRNFLGQGYYGTFTPPVIQRNVLENPGWYTAYTPYQAEISQGRMEALMNFQTMVCELTGLPVANASLLDEGTAVAEAVALCLACTQVKHPRKVLVGSQLFAQNEQVLKTRLEALGLEIAAGYDFEEEEGVFAAVIQYPAADGQVQDWRKSIASLRRRGVLVIMACDLLSLTLLTPPGELGADVAVGSSQRFGVPLGFGGPHAAFMACRDEWKRKLPGRLIGRSIDAQGQPAYRLTLQTREQHIRREKATSNICTAQVLLAVMAGMYAVWHGPEGLQEIAARVHALTARFAGGFTAAGGELRHTEVFDTLTLVVPAQAATLLAAAAEAGFNVRQIDADHLSLSFDETTTEEEATTLLAIFHPHATFPAAAPKMISMALQRSSDFLTQEVFHRFRTEHEMLRYLHRLETMDLALNESMIALGSCTMKLNAAAEMTPLTWPTVGGLHPFCPEAQAQGYSVMTLQLESWLSEITGFAACSLQPNAGSAGEFAGLLAIREYHQSKGDSQRVICLIPTSAHGTNPASAVMAGMKVVPVACDDLGNIDLTDLRAKADQHSEQLAALMVTYPSTHGVFEESIREICAIIHEHGGQVYMDGANMNAQVGLTSPGLIGADVCHLNLHKTFCIPHGGGGPGVGPICVAAHLADFLPSKKSSGTRIAAAPFGSASILTISWMYIRMMGADGLTEASRRAILHANYIAHKLDAAFPVLYRGPRGLVAHECIIDLRKFKDSSGITVEDVAKRLIDYGYHSPTMSWPVPGTLMIEPTESESQSELDRFCAAMLSIHAEITAIEQGTADRVENVLKHAPHTAAVLLSDSWSRPYSREQAAFPQARLRHHKYWPPVSRVDNVYGDKHLVCTCDPVSSYTDA